MELAREGWVESVPTNRRCWAVLVHQVLALTLQYGAVSAERCWEQLHIVSDFAGIHRGEFDQVIEHMKREDFLFESGGLLSMGQKAERVFGKKNLLELYAVFSSPVLYKVHTAAGRELGSLEQAFVDRLVEQMTAFLLAGRGWLVEHVNHEDRTVRVREAPRGKKPTWGGYVPQHLGFELCQRMKSILTEATPISYAEPPATTALQAKREELGELLRRPMALQMDDGSARWCTFAGGRINQTLKHALEWSQGWKVVADNFELRIEGPGVSDETVRQAARELASAEFWERPETRSSVLNRLPAYRLTKFQDAMPDAMAVEMVGNYLLDIPGARAFLSQCQAFVPEP